MADEPTEKPIEETTESLTDNMDLDLIEKTNQAAERLETATKNMETVLADVKKVETIRIKAETEKLLSGKTTTQKIPPKELTPAEYAAKVMANEV